MAQNCGASVPFLNAFFPPVETVFGKVLAHRNLVMVEPPDTPRLSSRRAIILCVDDSADMLFICRRFLEARGYVVLTASSGEAALRTLREHPVDAAITDNEMPGMTGLQLAQEMKHMQNNLPVLMFSSARPHDSSSVDYYLDKYFGPLALVNALQSFVPSGSDFSKHSSTV